MLTAPPTSPQKPPAASLLWDVFSRVIDNFGDLGVCWRLCADLAARGHRVRLWVDDAQGLAWMAPGALQGSWPGIQVLDWAQSTHSQTLAGLPPADVWIEGFGCEIAPEFIANQAINTWATGLNDSNFPVWINLEYLSAESYVERAHALPSPVMQGPAAGRNKYFFYPGFTDKTGGLLREPGLLEQIKAFDQPTVKAAWLAQHGIDWRGETLVSMFCYEPALLPALLAQWAYQKQPTRLLVASGRASLAVQAALEQLKSQEAELACFNGATVNVLKALSIHYVPALSQVDFDRLLWCCDLNFVRGEDSLVRALWAGKPLVWQIYPQDDSAHQIKLEAFLRTLAPPESLAEFHRAWNANTVDADAIAALPELEQAVPTWRPAVQSLRVKLLEMDDLSTQLVRFVFKKR